VWLLCSVALLTTALLLTLSRSGLAAAAVALICARLIGPRDVAPRRRWMYGVGAAVVMFGMLWTGPAALAGRWGSAEIGQQGRSVIWRDTMPIVRDFWMTGTGVGTYGVAMSVYQQSDRTVQFNQAHNHYLQVAAEGGVLVGLPVLFALSALARAILASLRADRSPLYWIRAGAAAGLCGVAVQSLWETGLTIPANAAFAAVLAAVVVHDRDGAPERH
jgi:O-antigen ligase